MTAPSPLLTICIPSYNRGARVESLARYLFANFIPHSKGDVEVIVSNNCSTDDTIARLQPFESQGLRLINRAEFLLTVEEHIFTCVDDCRGEYVWFLGDDEVLNHHAFLDYLETLRTADIDLLVSNFGVIGPEGGLLTRRAMPINRAWVDLPGNRLMTAAGFCFVLAGISGVIMRRSMVTKERGMAIHKIAPIYSHVAWLLESFSAGKTRIVNMPLVHYRVADDAYQLERLQKVAKAGAVGDYYCWSFGMVKLLDYLIRQGAVSPATIAAAYESRRDGSRFRLLDELVRQLHKQIKCAIDSGEPRNRILPEEFEQAMRLLYSVDLFTFDALAPLADLVKISHADLPQREKQKRARPYHEAFYRITGRQDAHNQYAALFQGFHEGHQLYRTPAGWAALSPRAMQARDVILAYIDPAECPPDVFAADDMEALKQKIDQALGAHEGAMPHPAMQDLLNDAVPSKHGEAAARAAHALEQLAGIYEQVALPLRMILYPIRKIHRLLHGWRQSR